MARPLGITVLAILQLLGAILGLLGAGAAILLALALGPLGFIALLLAAVMLVFAIIGFVLFYGLWNLKGWAWIWTLIINIINILLALFPVNVVSLIIPVIIVVYLLIPSTRAAFKQ